jgi:hypothetical protein
MAVVSAQTMIPRPHRLSRATPEIDAAVADRDNRQGAATSLAARREHSLGSPRVHDAVSIGILCIPAGSRFALAARPGGHRNRTDWGLAAAFNDLPTLRHLNEDTACAERL